MKHLDLSFNNLRRLPGLLAAGLALLAAAPDARAQMPANLDFASGNFSNWKTWVGSSARGTAATGSAFTAPALSAPIGGSAPGPANFNKSRHAVTSGTATDYYGGFPTVAPSGGAFSMRLGTDSIEFRAERIQYFVHVPSTSTSYNIQYQYAVVLQDGQHAPEEQSSFQVIAYDSATGAVIPGANNMYIAKWAIPGFSPFTDPVTSQVDSFIAWLPWTASTINLSGMAGKTVVIECTALACALGGHWGYGYLDVTSVADSLAPVIVGNNAEGDSVTIQGPAGYKTYSWFTQDFKVALNAATDTARTKTLALPSTAQYYNLVITPYASIGVPDTIRTPLLKKRSLGVSSQLLAGAQVYPNPSSLVLNLSFGAPFAGTVSIYSTTGERIYTRDLRNSSTFQIPTAQIATGTYTLVLSDEQGASTARQILINR